MIAGPVEDHRGRERGSLVYPVFSRRSRGVSVGINLFPDKKRCSFDCPYCEVFPFAGAAAFSLALMEESLQETLAEFSRQGTPAADVCFSGSGEPTMSAHFPRALESAARIRAEFTPAPALVLITNGTGLLDPGMFEILRRAAAGPFKLDIWLKLDAGT
ncbi:MAG: radical SAM protein, partial [Treponema sp.]|nr:radical SAM protein [Treponema sp.]